MVTAVTLLDRKWPHLAESNTVLLRAHVGRIDDRRAADLSDADLTIRVASELARIFGRWPATYDSMVVRWNDALPQYRVGHGPLVLSLKAAAAELGIALCGSAYDGVGIPASVGSGRRAAREVLEILGPS